MNRTLLAAALSATALCAGLAAAPLAHAQTAPPTLEQLCTATDIGQVNVLLAGLAPTDELTGDLAPLGEVTVPGESGKLVVDATVTLAGLREKLGCLPADPDPTTTTTPPTTTTGDGTPDGGTSGDNPNGTDTPTTTTTPSSPSTTVDPIGDDGSTASTGGDQVKVVPEGSANTGQA